MHTVVEEPRPGLLHAVRRSWGLVVAAVVVAMAAGAFVVAERSGVHVASAEMHMADPRAQGVFGSDAAGDDTRRQQNRVERLRSAAVLSRAAEIADSSLRLNELRAAVEATPSVSADRITVTASASSPTVARDLANAVVVAYREQFRADAQAGAARVAAALDARVGVLEAQLVDLEAELAAIQEAADDGESAIVAPDEDEEEPVPAGQAVLEARRVALLGMVEAAVVERERTMIEAEVAEDVLDVETARLPSSESPSPWTTLGVALVLGLAAGCLLAAWRSERQLERLAATPAASPDPVPTPVVPAGSFGPPPRPNTTPTVVRVHGRGDG